MSKELRLKVALALFALVFSSMLTAFPVFLLWNALAPEIFGLKTISFVQSLGLSLLCGFLFKSSGK